MSSTSRQIVRQGDKILCTCFCKKKKCPDGVVLKGNPKIFVEGKPVAVAGSQTSNCCGSCCKCPNHILKGSKTTIPSIARLGDPVSCGIIVGSCKRTFLG